MKRLFIVLSIFALIACQEAPVQCPSVQDDAWKAECYVKGVVPGMDFPVMREAAPDAWRVYPTESMKVIDGKGYFYFTEIDSVGIKDFFDYLNSHGIKEAIIEIHSPGGALFEAQRIVSLIEYWQKHGVKVETRIFGMAFSAGFYVFVAGEPRLVSPSADLMWHELKSASFGFGFTITTPADREEEARVLRHLQDVRNNYLAKRGNLSKAEIDNLIAKKEFWMSGFEAMKYGFADGLL